MLKPASVPHGGFCFENCQRNASLERAFPGLRVPRAHKTGTTIAGLVFRDGVILGADTRATDAMVVVDKNCEKIHYIAPKIYCCGAGVAADAEMTTRMAASNMELHALSTGREPRVATVTRFLRQMLFRIWAGCGSGSTGGPVPAEHDSEQSLFPQFTLEAAQGLLVEAITAGILGDLGSGGSVDACLITATGTKLLRTLSSPIEPVERLGHYRLAPGTTAVLTQTVQPLNLELLEETVQAMEVE
ncbi:proteasome subunit beta type-10 isoform X2 [Octodon degus]|uniref:Proteasome subunit beta n=1 Tax=Octodon degus TaxID=10160 RepID=A0A6P6DZH9_OCTDE|nr:proteasome subunit beta type-10 isoform X2 [Octodon degus]